MSENDTVKETYLAGYEAFEQGDFEKAAALADACLERSPQPSYWYAGALGLKCWAANFMDNRAEAERTATALLALDAGTDKAWFDGLALLNLGLVKKKEKQTKEAGRLFLRAARQYEAYAPQPEQPREWQYVVGYFSALCKWAATNDPGEWEKYLACLKNEAGGQSDLVRQVSAAAQVALRYSEGKDVTREVLELVGSGVSRTFLSVLLLG